MATKSKRKGINYNCETFQRIRANVKIALETTAYRSETSFGDTLVQDLAEIAFGVLITEKIITKQGKQNSESRWICRWGYRH